MVNVGNVYVLDDVSSARKGLSHLLRAYGFNALSFSDVSNFLKGLKPDGLGLLITDLQMPRLSVEALVKELKYREFNMDWTYNLTTYFLITLLLCYTTNVLLTFMIFNLIFI